MSIAIGALTMLILPLASIPIATVMHPHAALPFLVGFWFVVWGVGVRLGLTGLRQVLKPRATTQGIFATSGEGSPVLVRELGTTNLAIGVVWLLALASNPFCPRCSSMGTALKADRSSFARSRGNRSAILFWPR